MKFVPSSAEFYLFFQRKDVLKWRVYFPQHILLGDASDLAVYRQGCGARNLPGIVSRRPYTLPESHIHSMICLQSDFIIHSSDYEIMKDIQWQ